MFTGIQIFGCGALYNESHMEEGKTNLWLRRLVRVQGSGPSTLMWPLHEAQQELSSISGIFSIPAAHSSVGETGTQCSLYPGVVLSFACLLAPEALARLTAST